MTTHDVAEILARDLGRLSEELQAYDREEDLWKTSPGISNSTGTLALHLLGNLQHYLGAVLGETGYVRDRDAEFSRRDVPRAEIVAEIERTREVVRRVVPSLDDAALGAEYPQEVAGRRMTTGYHLIHLVAHFAYHLGQVNYHRRLLGNRE
jgi:uncharacterized damage-inducible protein DinB